MNESEEALDSGFTSIYIYMYHHHHQFLTPAIWRRWVRMNDLHCTRSFVKSPLLPSMSVQLIQCPPLHCLSIIVSVCLCCFFLRVYSVYTYIYAYILCTYIHNTHVYVMIMFMLRCHIFAAPFRNLCKTFDRLPVSGNNNQEVWPMVMKGLISSAHHRWLS